MKTDTLTITFLNLRDKLHRSALRFLGDDEDAKDALQDTFGRLWNARRPESEEEAANKLFAALRNICIDKIRRQPASAVEIFETDAVTEEPEIPDDVDQLERLISSGLTDSQRRVYELIAHEGLEYEEIARRLKMSVPAVRMNMSRARQRIRENYKNLER